jgi:DNA-directed RNA polymerase specialized sigma24 family protein
MSNDTMAVIDTVAENFHATGEVRYFNEFVGHATPVIKRFISKACAGSNWDTDELFSILLTDMWRLINRWEPEEGKQFHWLMLRQIRNKTINYIHTQMGRPHKICPTCGARQKKGTEIHCCVCNSPLRVSDIIIAEPFEHSHAHSPDYLEDIANKQLVQRLLAEVEDDPKTHRILTMLLEGESKTTISAEVHIAQNALNNRLRKCKRIIHKLMKETA